ncbi:hypothetical protein [Paraburkholderia caffeinilytica]
MLKNIKKISLRIPVETCLAVKAALVFERDNYFRQFIFTSSA